MADIDPNIPYLADIKAAIDHGLAQAEDGQTMTVAESHDRTITAIMRVAAEQAMERAITQK